MHHTVHHYRNHVIFVSLAGLTPGPWVPSYSVWRLEPANAYRAVLQGGPEEKSFTSPELAVSQAIIEAQASLDVLLDKQ